MNPPFAYPTSPDGRVRIEYWINPFGLDTEAITVEQAEAAIAAAFDTWARAAPKLLFIYRGLTGVGSVRGDGMNVIVFTAAATFAYPHATNGRPEFDIEFTRSWTWTPCGQRDGSCTPHKVYTPTGGIYPQLEDAAAHEVGHALWLGHVDEDGKEMTMYPGKDAGGSRARVTLGLGDVLGIRKIYPCSCPLPSIYSP